MRDLAISDICRVMVRAKKENKEIDQAKLIKIIAGKYNVSGGTARDYLNVAIYRLHNIGIQI